MNSARSKSFVWSGVVQELAQALFYRQRGINQYHKSSLKADLVWYNYSQETGRDGARPADANVHIEKSKVRTSTALFLDTLDEYSKSVRWKSSHSNDHGDCKSANKTHITPEGEQEKDGSPDSPARPQPCDGHRFGVSVCSSDEPAGADASSPASHSDLHWEEPAGGGAPIAWDPDVAADCERTTLLSSPLPPPAVPERARQADPAADAQLRQLASSGQLSAALNTASALSAAGTPPSFPALALLADEAARRAEHTVFERARRLAARLYPVNYGRAARLRDSQLELLWRRRLYDPACGLLLRYRAEPVRGQLMARRFAVCCCLAAREGTEDALPHIQRTAAALMARGLPGPLLSAWQHCSLSDQHGFREAGRQLLLRHPAARRHLSPHLLLVLEEAQLAGREDVLRGLLELVLRLGETRLYPLVFGALLDFQCLIEDVRSARETFKLAGELSISLPSTVLNRYSSLLQRHRLKAPAALLRMKYRQRPPDGSAAAPRPVPPAPAWWDKW